MTAIEYLIDTWSRNRRTYIERYKLYAWSREARADYRRVALHYGRLVRKMKRGAAQ